MSGSEIPAWSGGVVLPARDAAGEFVVGPDEDELTYAFSAFERWELLVPETPVERIHLFGEPLTPLVTLLPAALGRSQLPVTIHSDSAAAVEEVLSSATTGRPNGATVLVAARARPSVQARLPSSPGAAGTALAIVPSPSRLPPVDPARSTSEVLRGVPGDLTKGSDALARLLKQLASTASHATVAEGAPWAGRLPEQGAVVALDEVSEGAYLPRPSYLEDLPARWRFAAARCARCGTVTFPARARCRGCGSTEGLSAVTLPRWGLEVEAVTTVHPGAQPSEFDWRVASLGAYDVALVRLDVGVRATLQGSDLPAGSVRSGDRVDSALRRLYPMEGEWRYGRKMVPRAVTQTGIST